MTCGKNPRHQWIPTPDLFVFILDQLNICPEYWLNICTYVQSGGGRCVGKFGRFLGSAQRERKEGSVIRRSVARFFPNGKSNLWLGNKLDFLRIEITQQTCISTLVRKDYKLVLWSTAQRIAIAVGRVIKSGSTLLVGFTMVYTP